MHQEGAAWHRHQLCFLSLLVPTTEAPQARMVKQKSSFISSPHPPKRLQAEGKSLLPAGRRPFKK